MDSLVKTLGRTARAVTRSCGVDIVRFQPLESLPQGQRTLLMRNAGINLVFDVGGNVGQFGNELRMFNYHGDILSFEPQSAAFRQLQANSAHDSKWQAFNFAFGEEPGTTTIHLSQNCHSSSLLPMLDAHLESAPESAYIGEEEIQVRTLNDFWQEHGSQYTNRGIMLKIDVQGFEKYVLAGAADFLPYVSMVQLEMSLVGLYDHEMLYQEMIDYLRELGFSKLLSLMPGHSNPKTGRLLQFDGVFGR